MDHLRTTIIKFSAPDVFESPDRCIVWQGNNVAAKSILRSQRLQDGTKYIGAIRQKLTPRIYDKTRYLYVQRVIHIILTGAVNFKARQVCATPGCISHHPNHWVFSDTPPPAEPPQVPDDWTLQEAIELVHMFFAEHREFNPHHNLLIDIPPALLKEALAHVHPPLQPPE